jgi:hypothetical protein
VSKGLWNVDLGNEIAWRENGLHVWRCARQPVQGREEDGPDAARACNANRRVKRNQLWAKSPG